MSSKGVTPVIATVLLIMISVGATASAFTFMNTIMNSQQEQIENRLTQEELEDQTSFNIDYVYNSSDGYTLMSVRNSGQRAIQIEENNEKLWTLFVDGGPDEWIYENTTYQSMEDLSIDPSRTITLNTTAKYPSKNDDLHIQLSGPYEASDSYVCYNSGSQSC